MENKMKYIPLCVQVIHRRSPSAIDTNQSFLSQVKKGDETRPRYRPSTFTISVFVVCRRPRRLLHRALGWDVNEETKEGEERPKQSFHMSKILNLKAEY